MAAWVDNLQNFNTKIEIDKNHLQNIFGKALEEAEPRINRKLKFSSHETWIVRRPQNGGILTNNNNDRNTVDVVIQLISQTQKNNNTQLSSFTLKFYDKKYKSQNLYGLNQELNECPDFTLSKEEFKSKYSYSKKSIVSNNYSILASNPYDKFGKEYKHLNMYLNQILKSYCNIFDNHGLNYKEETHANYYQTEDNKDSPLYKEIILLDSNGNDFISIRLSALKELRLINSRFVYDYKIRVSFERFCEEKNPFIINGVSRNLKRRESIKYSNNFHLLFLNQLENPNYYFFIASPRGLVKMNKNILEESILSVFTHYILTPLLKEANIEFEHNDLNNNLGNYLLMYEMVKY